MNATGVSLEVEWQASHGIVLVPVLAVLVVGAWSLLYDLEWLTSPCVDWDAPEEDYLPSDTHPGCQGYEITTNSRSQAVAFTVAATAAFAASAGLATAGLLRRRAAWFWAGLAALVVVSIPRLYAFLFFEEPSPFRARDSIVQYMGEPWHMGVATLAAFFLAARVLDLAAPEKAFSTLPMKGAAVVLLILQALWLYGAVAIDGELFDRPVPPMFWVLVLTPPVTTVIAFWRLAPPDRTGAAPS